MTMTSYYGNRGVWLWRVQGISLALA